MNFSKNLLIAAFGILAAGASMAADEGHKVLADRHAGRGIDCMGCHNGAPTKDVDMTACLKCHGGSYAELAKRTDKSDLNAHATHLGEAQCVSCHSGHKKPQLACDNCHEFPELKVP